MKNSLLKWLSHLCGLLLYGASKINPDDYEALYSRGIAYKNKGNYDRAIEDFEAVLKIDPNDVKTRENLELVR